MLRKQKTSNRDKQLKSKKSIRYTAAKLREKGVLIEVEGLPDGQFKNAQFEICPTDLHGVFLVKGKFMGVEMETINIDIQVISIKYDKMAQLYLVTSVLMSHNCYLIIFLFI